MIGVRLSKFRIDSFLSNPIQWKKLGLPFTLHYRDNLNFINLHAQQKYENNIDGGGCCHVCAMVVAMWATGNI